MSRDFLSTAGTDAAIHAVSWFRHAFDPIAADMEAKLTADAIIERVAPKQGPRLVESKMSVPYFVPTLLKYAPFVAETGRKRPGQSGHQRSSSHVIAGAWFALDLDKLTTEDLARIIAKLEASGTKFVVYSSFSYGSEDKPGVQARVLLFMDRSLEPLDWKRAWGVVNKHLLFGVVDKQTGHLAQQEGAWATPPSRRDLAFRHEREGAPLSADALLAKAGPPKSIKRTKHGWSLNAGLRAGVTDPARVAAALAWLDADDYETWMGVGLGLKAGVMLGHLSEDAGRGLWLAFSERADERAKARNDDAKYCPETLWERLEPSAAPREALFASILGRARDQAKGCVETAIRQNTLTPESQRAAEYLGRFHRDTTQQLFGDAR